MTKPRVLVVHPVSAGTIRRLLNKSGCLATGAALTCARNGTEGVVEAAAARIVNDASQIAGVVLVFPELPS